jgi:hypothetical protein
LVVILVCSFFIHWQVAAQIFLTLALWVVWNSELPW